MSSLSNNTTALQEILEAVNQLPDAGSGGGGGGTVSVYLDSGGEGTLYYAKEDGTTGQVDAVTQAKTVNAKHGLVWCKKNPGGPFAVATATGAAFSTEFNSVLICVFTEDGGSVVVGV